MIPRSLLRNSRTIRSRASTNLSYSFTPRHFSSILRTPPSSAYCLPSLRLYSSTTEAKGESASQGESSAISEGQAGQDEDPSKKELEAKNREIIDLKDKYLRSVADFRNLQERTKREIAAARDFAISKFAKDLIDSIDNLDRALLTVPEDKVGKEHSNKDLTNLHDGLKMTERILMQTLQKHGLERFDPSEKGEKFNPNLHEATFMTKVEGKEDGTAFQTVQKGFLLNGRVIRAAKVGVVKNT